MKRVFTIAEAGINHFGDMGLAKMLCHLSQIHGADMVKFQWYRPEEILGTSSPYFAEAKKAELSEGQIKDLKAYCDSLGIEFGLSVFHPDSIGFTEQIGLARYKVASRSVNDRALLQEINRTEKPVIMSTGMSTEGQIAQALDYLKDCDVTLLYCVCKYPSELRDFNLNWLGQLGRYSEKVGFSSHCPSISPTLAAVARGAKVTENHVYVVGAPYRGCDISSSLTFDQFSDLVHYIREMEEIL